MEVKIPVDKVTVEGNLALPVGALGIVIFAHGSGSSRFSTRNQYVAGIFNQSRIGTLLFDMLTQEEEDIDIVTTEYRFNIDLLAQRLIGATRWIKNNPSTKDYKLGYFGASTGAAAALIAAAELPNYVVAVVSRGGRPDLAGDYLPKVQAPTLLLVGGWDDKVIDLNKEAKNRMGNKNELLIIPGATHLFEEAGKLEEVAQSSRDWFMQYFR